MMARFQITDLMVLLPDPLGPASREHEVSPEGNLLAVLDLDGRFNLFD